MAKAKKNNVRHRSYVVATDHYILTAALHLLRLEACQKFSPNLNEIYEWYYAKLKDVDYANSTFASKVDRDPVAWSATESFRKTFKKGADEGFYTVKFLTLITSKLLTYGGKDWEQFSAICEAEITERYQSLLTEYGADNIMLAPDVHGKPNDTFVAMFAERLYDYNVTVSEYIHRQTNFRIISSRSDCVLLKPTRIAMSWLLNDASINKADHKLVRYYLDALWPHCEDCLYVLADMHNVFRYIVMLPLNWRGRDELLSPRKYIPHITWDMVCNSKQWNLLEAVYIDVFTKNTHLNRPYEFGGCIYDILESWFPNRISREFSVFMTNSNPEKSMLLKAYDFLNTGKKWRLFRFLRNFHRTLFHRYEYALFVKRNRRFEGLT